MKFPIVVLFLCISSTFISSFKIVRFVKNFPIRMSINEDTTISSKKDISFVQDIMRPYAMKLHSKDQAPREGQMKAQVPVSNWQPTRSGYLQFLVDSLEVYRALESVVNQHEILQPLRSTGLERVVALEEDIEWLCDFDKTLIRPPVGENGILYKSLLLELGSANIPKFICHFYNQYFAHTAGGLMIGKRMSDTLLSGATLKFYQWDSDVRILLDETRKKIDNLAIKWSEKDKQDCLEETMNCFKFGGSLMSSMKQPH